jgi:small subunit ribosomal protein S4
MLIGPRYKRARRLGSQIYDKTQTQKFAVRTQRKEKVFSRPKSDYGIQMLEKQKARFMYGVSERQFSNYVKHSIAQKKAKPSDELYMLLETRLDNVVYRLGLAPSRAASRQMVSHAHITVNGKKVTIPSYNVSAKDKIVVRASSQKKKLFDGLAEKHQTGALPNWVRYNPATFEGEVTNMPQKGAGDTVFDIEAIIEFYRR